MNNLLVDGRDQDFADQADRLSREGASLINRVAALQKENHYLRRSNRVRPQLRLVLRAEAAAQILAMWHCAGYMSGRKAAFAGGMSNSSFYAGRALCVLANVHNGHAWTTDNVVVIEQKLADAVAYARRNPEALVHNIPPSKRPKRFAG